MSRTSFSMLIPTAGRQRELDQCLQRATAQRLSSDTDLEIIVSSDVPLEDNLAALMQRYSNVHWVQGPGRGPAVNRNNAALYAKGQWLLFVDDDCIPDVTHVAGYAAAIERCPNINVFEGRTYVDRPRVSLAEFSPINEKGGLLWSCNFCIRRELYVLIGGFNERFPYAAMEDVELRYRLRQKNEPFQFVPEASVLHPWRIQASWRALKRHQYCTFVYLELHPEERQHISACYYLRLCLGGWKDKILPWLLSGKIVGLTAALLEQCSFFQMALLLAFKKYPKV